jgi:hypothetical protein
MALRKKNKKIEFANTPQQNAEVEDEVDTKELVYNMDDVRNAVKILLDFEKENNIQLINPKGKSVVADMYRRYEAQNKIIRTVDERIEKRLAPIERKQDQLMGMLKQMVDTIPGNVKEDEMTQPPIIEQRKEQRRRQVQQTQETPSHQE